MSESVEVIEIFTENFPRFRRQRFIGKVKFAQFEAISADKAIVVTEENVLASLSSKNGDILWRRILETDDARGNVKFLYVTKDSKNVASHANEADPYGVITVSGTNPVLFRGWDINNGNLAWEWSITPTSESEDSQYLFKDQNIYQVLPVWNSHIEITEYQASTGQQRAATTSKITAGWITKDKCVLSLNYFVCLVKDQLLVLDLLAEKNNVRTKAIDAPASDISIVRGREGFVQVGRQVISVADLQVVFENRKLARLYMDTNMIQLVKENKNIKITSDDQELLTLSDIPDTLDNNLHVLSAKCRPKKENIAQLACRFLLSTDDGAIVVAQLNKVKWIREEALTQIAAVEFLDLTLSDAQGAIEEELNNKDGELVGHPSRERKFPFKHLLLLNLFSCPPQRKNIVCLLSSFRLCCFLFVS